MCCISGNNNTNIFRIKDTFSSPYIESHKVIEYIYSTAVQFWGTWTLLDFTYSSSYYSTLYVFSTISHIFYFILHHIYFEDSEYWYKTESTNATNSISSLKMKLYYVVKISSTLPAAPLKWCTHQCIDNNNDNPIIRRTLKWIMILHNE